MSGTATDRDVAGAWILGVTAARYLRFVGPQPETVTCSSPSPDDDPREVMSRPWTLPSAGDVQRRGQDHKQIPDYQPAIPICGPANQVLLLPIHANAAKQ